MNDAQGSKPHSLWWENTRTNLRTYAGVAFYDDRFGEFRLRANVFDEGKQLYCRAIQSENEKVAYRVEIVKKKNGKFWKREKAGEGLLSKETNGEIHLQVPPYESKLILVPSEENFNAYLGDDKSKSE